MARRTRAPSPPPAFFLEHPPGPTPRLFPGEDEHATRVLRLEPGALLVGLDGRGKRIPLRIRSVARTGIELEAAGPPELEPAPGEEGSALPWLEVVVSWPRKNRVEDMVGRLVQLGAACIRPLAARQRGPEPVPDHASERLQRVAREACKQSGRTWLPELAAELTPAELISARREGAISVLDPSAGLPFDSWLRSLTPSPLGLGTRSRPIVLVIGPEGGFTDEERNLFQDAGASLVWLGPHVLRVETAAEAAVAVAGAVHARRPASTLAS